MSSQKSLPNAESNAGFYVAASYICTFQISVDFYYVPVGGRGGRRGGAGEGEGGLE
jgi:hypothetical protein